MTVESAVPLVGSRCSPCGNVAFPAAAGCQRCGSSDLVSVELARLKALARLRGLAELDDPESLVVPILIDAILIAESYRGARHQITFLPELTRSVDELLRELTIAEKAKEMVEI